MWRVLGFVAARRITDESESFERLVQPMDAIGKRASNDPRPEQIESDLPCSHERTEHDPDCKR